MEYSTSDFIEAIERELALRATTYPKILKRMEKRGEDRLKIDLEQNDQYNQNYFLRNALYTIKDPMLERSRRKSYEELLREYKMRVKIYPYFIFRKRIEKEKADFEIDVWKALVIYYAENFLPNQDYTKDLERKTRRKLITAQ